MSCPSGCPDPYVVSSVLLQVEWETIDRQRRQHAGGVRWPGRGCLARSRSHCGPKGPLGVVAVHREHHTLQGPRLVLADGVDHQPRRLLEREAADPGAESDKGKRNATEGGGPGQG